MSTAQNFEKVVSFEVAQPVEEFVLKEDIACEFDLWACCAMVSCIGSCLFAVLVRKCVEISCCVLEICIFDFRLRFAVRLVGVLPGLRELFLCRLPASLMQVIQVMVM